jgi:hypothetical protein
MDSSPDHLPIPDTSDAPAAHAAHSAPVATGEVPSGGPVAPVMPGVAADQHCLQCGYALRGQSTAGMCPECGTPVARSMHGNLLRYSSTEFVRMLRLGALLIIIGIIADVVHAALSGIIIKVMMTNIDALRAQQNLLESVQSISDVVIAMLTALGWWLLSAPDPAYVGRDSNERSRVLVRISVIIIILTLLPRAMEDLGAVWLPGGLRNSLTMISALTYAASFFPAMLYLGKLALRFPSRKLADRAYMFLWLLPVILIVGLVACGLGYVVSKVLYCLFIGTVFQLLSRTLEIQRDSGFVSVSK